MMKRAAGWIHATLIMATILPLLYIFGAGQPDTIGGNLYYKCLLIAFPVVATDFAIKRCKGLFSYLVISILVFAMTAAMGWFAAGALRQSLMFGVYMVVLLAETMFVIVTRMANRLRKKREEDTWDKEDPSMSPSVDGLSTPSFYALIYFIFVYVFAVNLNNSAVCNAALFGAIVYTLITFLYEYICGTEEYLTLNKRTCNIPSKRIYGIGNGMLAIFLLLFVIVILPVLFSIPNRHYRDLRKSFASINIDSMESVEEYRGQNTGGSPMEIPMELLAEPKPVPEWIENLIYILAAVFFLFLVAALMKAIYNTFRVFRESADENGDVVEELQEMDEGVKIKKLHKSRVKLSERERIRREYKRFIRRHRKERPACYESPAEIEQNAGIAESEESKELHRQYEQARYGCSFCAPAHKKRG